MNYSVIFQEKKGPLINANYNIIFAYALFDFITASVVGIPSLYPNWLFLVIMRVILVSFLVIIPDQICISPHVIHIGLYLPHSSRAPLFFEYIRLYRFPRLSECLFRLLPHTLLE